MSKQVPEVISPERLYELLSASEHLNEQDKVLASILYLTGCRILEAWHLLAKDIREGEIEGEKVYLFDLWTAKNPKHPRRTIPVFNDSLIIENMLAVIYQHVGFLKEEENLFPKSYSATARSLQRNLYKTTIDIRDRNTQEQFEFHLHPHYLRHCRLTHLVNQKGLSAHEVMQFAGWSSVTPFQTYISVDWQTIAKKLLKQ